MAFENDPMMLQSPQRFNDASGDSALQARLAGNIKPD